MNDDLTAQVEERLFDMLNNPDIPEDDAGELAAELAPRIAACMRAVHSKTLYDVENGEPIEPTDTEADAYAAGLQALRGET